MLSEVVHGEREWLVVEGDCLRTLWQLPDESVDAVVVDPPYGIGYRSDHQGGIANDRRPFIWWLFDAYRVATRNAALICSCRCNVQEVFRVAIETAGFTVRSQVMWDRGRHSGGNTAMQFAPQHDVMLLATKGRFAFAGARPKSVVRANRPDWRAASHPTEKPVDLMVELVSAVTPIGGLVLDPCAGSGSTGVAALRCGRRFIGIELSQEYAAVAAQRLNQEALVMDPWRARLAG